MENNKSVPSKFKFFDHTADVKFEAYGKNLDEAFSNAILATTNVIADFSLIKTLMEIKISIKSKTKESLLFDLLEELIFYLDTEAFLTSEVKELTISNSDDSLYKLKCVLLGDKCTKYDTTGDIKSATYNDMSIVEKNFNDENKITVTAVLDL